MYRSIATRRSPFSDCSLWLVAAAATLFAVFQAATATPTDVVWYISAVNGSTDIATCGHSIDRPCASLQMIIDQSPLFDNSSSRCHISLGDDDGRSSTTVYFLEGEHFVPPLCLMNWRNLRIAGLGRVVITSQDSVGATRAFFEFRQCSNISIENLEEFDTSFVGKSTLFFDNTSDIQISGCVFPVMRLQSTGVIAQRAYGTVEITDSRFFGNTEAGSTESYGLSITHGCADNGRSDAECSNTWPPIQILIRNTSFFNFTAAGAMPDDRYSSTRSDSIGMRIRFLSGSSNSTVLIENVQSSGNVNAGGSHTLVNFDSFSSGNTVRFSNCTFEDNQVRYGGGIAAYFYGGTRDNSLEIEDSRFLNNIADFEGGGVFVAYLESPENNLVQISRNTFKRNRAYSGAGVFAFNSPSFLDQAGLFDPVSLPLVTANLTNCTFRYNKATQLREGVITLLRMLFNITGIR